MLSSFSLCAAEPYAGPQVAPNTHRSSFLSVNPPQAAVGASDLGTLLNTLNGNGYTSPLGTYAVPRPGPVLRAQRAALPTGIGQYNVRHFSDGRFIESTIKAMHKAVMKAKMDPKWRALMEDIRREGRRRGEIGWKDYKGEVLWFDKWYRKIHPIDYVRDPYQVELVMHPAYTYKKQAGDCDDTSVLWAASLGSLGAAHRFRTYRADPRRPGEFTHVAAQVEVPGLGWVNNDLTIEGAKPGFEPKDFPFQDWPEPRY